MVAKRARAEPIEPPAPVMNRVFPEMYSLNVGEEGRESEWPANSLQMLSLSVVLSIICCKP